MTSMVAFENVRGLLRIRL